MAKIPQKLQIIPLGGLGEVGKNMTVVRFGDDIIVIDAGLMFPEDDMLGIDLVIPDITYLQDNRDLIRGIVLTHGHEDHIGALPYVLRELDVPVYGTRLTLGMLENRLRDTKVSTYDLRPVTAGSEVDLGVFTVGFIRVSHSIPDAVGLCIKTPLGVIVHTGDFKLDQTPVDGKTTDFHKFAELGDQGVLLLMADSTNAEQKGYTQSEKTVGKMFDEVFRNAKERIIISTFSSNIHRIQQVLDTADRYKRKVAVLGKNMTSVLDLAINLGYVTIPEGVLVDIDELNGCASSEIVILTTGNQGEPVSALNRLALAEHRKLNIKPGDTVVLSAAPVSGNEKLAARTVDHLFKQGAEVVYGANSGISVSGHASQEELKLMHNLIRPKFFLPVHGEYRHLKKHSLLAQQLGMPKDNIFVAENGQIIEFTKDKGYLAGKVTAGNTLVDGLGVGDVGNIVLRDRKQLSQDGILIVVVTMDKENASVATGPDIVSRGFVYVRESEGLMEEARDKVRQALEKCETNNITEWSAIKTNIRDSLSKFLYEKTRRRPMILPIIMEV